MQSAHANHFGAFNGGNARTAHNGGDGGVGSLRNLFGLADFRQAQVPEQAHTNRLGACPAPASTGGTERASTLAPENQHPNHPAGHSRAGGMSSSMQSMQPGMLQQQMQHNNQDLQPHMQQHRPMMQRQQMPIGSPPNVQSGEPSPHMSPNRNMGQLPPRLNQTPPNHAMQPQFSNVDQFHIPPSHHSSTSPSPSSSPANFPPSSPYHQRDFKQDHDETLAMFQVSPFSLAAHSTCSFFSVGSM